MRGGVSGGGVCSMSFFLLCAICCCRRGRSQTMGRWCSWCARRSSTRSLSVANSSGARERFLLLSFGVLQLGSGKCRAQLLVLLVCTPLRVSACFGAFFMAHCNYAFGDVTIKQVWRRRREIPILVAFSGPFRKWGGGRMVVSLGEISFLMVKIYS